MVHFSFRRLKEQQDFFIYIFILLKSFLLVFTINFASRLSTLMKANENGSSLNDAGLNNASSPAVRLPLRLRLAVEALPFVLRPRSATTSLVDSRNFMEIESFGRTEAMRLSLGYFLMGLTLRETALL